MRQYIVVMHREIAIHCIMNEPGRVCTHLRVIFYTDSQGMVVLTFTIVVRYYNCCSDGSTGPENFGPSRTYSTFQYVATCAFCEIRVTLHPL